MASSYPLIQSDSMPEQWKRERDGVEELEGMVEVRVQK
jgi:hypothetical protein